MTRVTAPHHTQDQYARDTIASLAYERDQAVACLEKIERMHSSRRMRERAKTCLRELELGRSE